MVGKEENQWKIIKFCVQIPVKLSKFWNITPHAPVSLQWTGSYFPLMLDQCVVVMVNMIHVY
jgi:hypothetical protein